MPLSSIRSRYFEVENVLLHTFKVKRNVGQDTPTKMPNVKGLHIAVPLIL